MIRTVSALERHQADARNGKLQAYGAAAGGGVDFGTEGVRSHDS
jgi:hypothetical protein